MHALPYSPVVLGLWPIAGVTSVEVTEEASRRTIEAALEAGVTTFDTAFSYGYEGESDRLLGDALTGRRDQCIIIGKVGQRWTADRRRVVDGSSETLMADAETSLRRLRIERFDLLMLHSVDPQVEVGTSMAALEALQRRGLADRIGVCNVDATTLARCAEAAPLSAVQWPLNMLQHEILEDRLPWCHARGIDVLVYWTLMKGILAGKIDRGHRFAPGDSRPGYEIYQGQSRERTHRIVDALKKLAEGHGCSVAQLAIGWTLAQTGVSAALVGAKRPEQIEETAGSRPLPTGLVAEIDQVVEANR